MDIVSWITGRVELNDPVNLWDIESSCSYVCTQENAACSVSELEESVGTLLLLLFALCHETHQYECST